MSTNSPTAILEAKIQFAKELKVIDTTMYNEPYLLPLGGSGLPGRKAQAGRDEFAENCKATTKAISREMKPHANSPKKNAKLLSWIVKNFTGQESAEHEL